MSERGVGRLRWLAAQRRVRAIWLHPHCPAAGRTKHSGWDGCWRAWRATTRGMRGASSCMRTAACRRPMPTQARVCHCRAQQALIEAKLHLQRSREAVIVQQVGRQLVPDLPCRLRTCSAAPPHQQRKPAGRSHPAPRPPSAAVASSICPGLPCSVATSWARPTMGCGSSASRTSRTRCLPRRTSRPRCAARAR